MQDATNAFTTTETFGRQVAQMSFNGRTLYAIRNGFLASLSVNLTSGALTSLQQISIGTIPGKELRLVTDPLGRFLYVTSQTPQSDQAIVTRFLINAATGEVTSPQVFSQCSGVCAENQMVGGAITPNGRFLYLARQNFGHPKIYVYEIDRATGSLNLLQEFPLGFGSSTDTLDLFSVAMETTGRYLYVPASRDPNLAPSRDIRQLTISQIVGHISGETLGPGTNGVRIETTGRIK
jgi:6-phosphogluconolactonase (cycloisomerase 2 family)